MPVPLAGAVTLGMAGLQLINGLQSAEMTMAQANLQAEIDNMNAEFKEIDAENELRQNYAEISRYRTQVTNTLADQEVTFAARGVDASRGVAAELMEESKLNGFLNTLDMQTAARTSNLQSKRDARGLRMNSRFRQMEARSSARAQVTSAVLSAGNTVASGYQRGNFEG